MVIIKVIVFVLIEEAKDNFFFLKIKSYLKKL